MESGQVVDEPSMPVSSARLQVESKAAVPSAASDVQLDDPNLAMPVAHIGGMLMLTAQEQPQHRVQVIIQVRKI